MNITSFLFVCLFLRMSVCPFVFVSFFFSLYQPYPFNSCFLSRHQLPFIREVTLVHPVPLASTHFIFSPQSIISFFFFHFSFFFFLFSCLQLDEEISHTSQKLPPPSPKGSPDSSEDSQRVNCEEVLPRLP